MTTSATESSKQPERRPTSLAAPSETSAEGDVSLVRGERLGAFVIEGGQRRQIRAGLLAAALEQVFGVAREVADRELERRSEGPAVEVLQVSDGPPFVVVGGRRLRLRGLPLPRSVKEQEARSFPEGPELNVAAALVPRARFESAVSGRYHLERARQVLEREGPVRGLVVLAQRAVQRLRRGFGQSTS